MRRALRTVGYLWATPTSLAAALLFLLPCWILGQARPMRWHDGVGEWTVAFGSRLFRRYTLRGWSATTLGYFVIYSPGQERDEVVARHERRHVLQALWLGPLFFPVYGAIWLFTGYRNHPMERDARAHEAR